MPPSKAGASTDAQRRAALRRPRTDPPTRADGFCYVCRGTRPAIALKHDDPFCSGGCARLHYGIPLANERGVT